MKKITLLIFSLFLTISLLSQTYIDYHLFNKCNEYRRQNGLKEWKWSDRFFEQNTIQTIKQKQVKWDMMKLLLHLPPVLD